MKIFKYAVWIVVIMLFQTVVVNEIQISGVCPDIVIPFVIITAIKEDSFKYSTAISIICGVAVGALCGRNFYAAVLTYTYLSAIIFNLRRYSGHLPDFIMYILWTIPAAIVSEAVNYLIIYMSFDYFLKGFILYILPAALYTLLIAVVLYQLWNTTLYGKGHGRKKLIVK